MMSHTARIFSLCTIAVLAAFAAGTTPRSATGEINWLESYPEALREAKRTGKPIFLEFRCEA